MGSRVWLKAWDIRNLVGYPGAVSGSGDGSKALGKEKKVNILDFAICG